MVFYSVNHQNGPMDYGRIGNNVIGHGKTKINLHNSNNNNIIGGIQTPGLRMPPSKRKKPIIATTMDRGQGDCVR